MFYYIAYGMNTNTNDMAWRCPDARILGVATLNDYILQFRYHADIKSAPGRSMQVLLWEISNSDLVQLDELEGYPTYYTRFTVPVVFNEQEVEAVIYQMNDQSYEQLPSNSYLDSCISGYEANSLDISQLECAYNSALFVHKID